MADKITASGVYDLTLQEYLGQPCDALSMSSSDAVVLTDSTPAHLRAGWEEADEGSKESDLGTVIHALILEPHRAQKTVAVIEAKNWTTNAAKSARDAAREEGKTPILTKDYDRAMRAVEAVMAHPVASKMLVSGITEASWFAKDEATGLYRKARTDFFTSDRIIVDLKTVGSASPDFLRRRLFDGGWFQQAPWHCDVVERVEHAPARGYCWVVVEQKPPHAVVVRRPPDSVLMHGDRLNKAAFSLFARCAATGEWPAYGLDLAELDLPDFAYYRLEADAVEKESTGMEALRLSRETGGHPFS